jgi:all-trans-retinol 13,14-reductase
MLQNVKPAGSILTNYGIVAWIFYGVLSGSGHWIVAALGALVLSIAILAHEYTCHAVKILNCTAAGFFAFSLATTIAVGPALFKDYNAFLPWLVFAIVTWVTLLIGFPFTLQYAREQAPREVWDHPLFMRLNVILTLGFGLMFTVNAGLGVTALTTGHLLTFGLLLPISLLIACIVFSKRYPKRYIERAAPEWAATPAANAR